MRKFFTLLSCISIFSISVISLPTEGKDADFSYDTFLEITKTEKQILPNITIKKIQSTSSNTYPIILVHGLAGWGRDEMLGFRYWGGLRDIEKDLNKHHHTTYTAAVGPISSNWDRAVELYTQIKGGVVDYGVAHSRKHHHARFGRSYSGILTHWGKQNKFHRIEKVHLLGHSMGGQTIRVLNQLLMHGDKDEQAATLPQDISPLFNSIPKPWVASITAIASPHSGSPFMYAMKPITPLLKKIIALTASATRSQKNPVYDFKLDQWGLKRKPKEAFHTYCNRISDALASSKDLADHDLTPEGAARLNHWVKPQPHTYHFSISAEQTYKDITTGHYLPHLFMNPLFYISSTYIGSYTQTQPISIDHTWWKNDGLVSTNSMKAPPTEPFFEYNGHPQKGVWNHLGVMNSFDHLDLIGIGIRDMRKWYRSIAELLNSLPY